MRSHSLSVLIISLVAYAAQAFTINTPSSSSPISKTCSQSCLFHTPVVLSPSRTFSQLSQKLKMTSDSSSSNSNDKEPELSTEIGKNESVEGPTKQEADGSRNMLINALIYGPPLIAKFSIVILIKIVTDLVVMPFLFLYRFLNLTKNKVVGLFNTKEDLLSGEKINGAS